MDLQDYQHFRHTDWRCLRKKYWIFVCGKVGSTKKGENLKNSVFYSLRLM